MAYTVKMLKEDLEKLPEDWIIRITDDYTHYTLYAESTNPDDFPYDCVDIFTD